MGRLSFESAERSHVGCVRKLNEDRVLSRADLGLWAVADGMGGHQAGDLASGMLIDALANVEQLGSGYAFLEEVQESVQRVNRTLVAHARLAARGTVIGSTLVALLAYEGHFACLWAGDSRVYRMHADRLDQITRDHSMVQELIDSGALRRTDAPAYGRSNVITRAVGVNDRLALDVITGPLREDDVFVLCSDGLTGALSDSEIEGYLALPSLEGAADAMLRCSLDRGAKDNVSFVIVRVAGNADDTLRTNRLMAFD